MGLEVQIAKLRRALADNSTAASYTAVTPTATKPETTTTRAVVDLLAAGGRFSNNCLKVIPFGGDANNETLAMQVIGWNWSIDDELWIPQLIAELALTLGNIATGTTNEFMCDTLVITHGVADEGVQIVTNGADAPAYALIKLPGFELIEFQFKTSTGANTNTWYGFTDSVF